MKEGWKECLSPERWRSNGTFPSQGLYQNNPLSCLDIEFILQPSLFSLLSIFLSLVVEPVVSSLVTTGYFVNLVNCTRNCTTKLQEPTVLQLSSTSSSSQDVSVFVLRTGRGEERGETSLNNLNTRLTAAFTVSLSRPQHGNEKNIFPSRLWILNYLSPFMSVLVLLDNSNSDCQLEVVTRKL